LVVVVAFLARTAGAQFSASYPSLPFPLEKAIDSADVGLIVRARVSATRNGFYTMKRQGGPTVQMPANYVTVVVVEVFKDHKVVKPGRSLEIGHLGFTADDRSSEAVRRDSDPQWLPLEVGREYVLFVSINQLGELGFYGPQGVFGARDGKVVPLVPSRVGETWKGKSWETFVQTIRRHSQKQPR
jgi:hypothetical protein